MYCIDRRIKIKTETIAKHIFQERVFDEKKDEKTLNFTVSAADRSAALRHGFRVGGSCGSRGRRKCCRRNSRSSRSDRNGRGIGRAETEAPAEEVQPDCSSWAVEEVREAIAEGLVPEHLQSGYQQPVTRGELAELTAYYVLWHEPEGTTMEEVWPGRMNIMLSGERTNRQWIRNTTDLMRKMCLPISTRSFSTH